MDFLRKQLFTCSFLYPLSICFFLNLTMVTAQLTAVKTDVSDPKTRAFLDKVKKQYEGYSTLEMKFKVERKAAEQPKADVSTGKFAQQGDSYRVDMDNDIIFSDGKIIWHKTGNVVQITNAGGKSSNEFFLSPKELLKKIFEKNEYIFGITAERAEGWSTKATIVTLKPVNNRRGSDFTKIEVAIDQKTNYIVSVLAFGRHQSRSKFSLEPPTTNQKQDASKFVFDKSKYPGVKVEDLRVD